MDRVGGATERRGPSYGRGPSNQPGIRSTSAAGFNGIAINCFWGGVALILLWFIWFIFTAKSVSHRHGPNLGSFDHPRRVRHGTGWGSHPARGETTN